MSFRGFYLREHVSANLFPVQWSLSSQAGAKSSDEQEEDALVDGFPELEVTDSAMAVQNNNSHDGNVDKLISETIFPEIDDDDVDASENDLEISDSEADSSEGVRSGKWAASALSEVITAAPAQSVRDALDKWVEEGNKVERADVYLTMLDLHALRMYGRALQFSKWLEASKQIEFTERDYVSRADLIAKVHGLEKAEKYMDSMPKSFRGELVYRTLLANCVLAVNVKKSEEVFNKMKDLELPVTAFAWNQLLLLYSRTDDKKMEDILLMVEEENLKPSRFTYELLLDTKAQQSDITGMEQIFERMKSEGIEPGANTKFTLARHYASIGLKEKAVALLKEVEGGKLGKKRWACRSLLPIYGELGEADEMERVMKVCESNPTPGEFIAIIEALGKLKKIEEAEAVFEMMMEGGKKPSSFHYAALLKVYANNKMLTKGNDLIKCMMDSGCRIDRMTCDSIVNLYLEAGEIEKADSILQKAAQHNQSKPMFRSYAAVMDQYAMRGDIHNTENIFHRMKQAGYLAELSEYQTLLKAYIIAKLPAYGMRDRMKADNVVPDRELEEQLVQLDPIRKTAVSDVLD